MKVHYFYSRKESYKDRWVSVKLEAITEEDVTYAGSNEPGKSFTYVEIIDIHIHKKMEEFHTSSFMIDFGKNSVRGSSARSVKELYGGKKNDKFENFIPVTRAQYERIRKIVFARYEKEKYMNFDLLSGEPKGRVTIL